MKKLNALIISIFMISIYTTKSQTLVNETAIDLFGSKEKGAKFTLKEISCKDDKLEIGAFVQRKATIDNKKSFQVLKEGYFPGIKLFELNKDLSNIKTTYKNINLNSLFGTNSEYRLLANKTEEIANSKTDLAYEELQKQYPNILMPKNTKPKTEKYFIETERNVKKRIYKSNFDIVSNSISKIETGIDKINLEYPETEIIRKKYGYGLSNNKNNRFIFVSGLYYDKKARKADPTKKWNEYRQYEFNTFDRNGKCLNTYNINFDYPKIIKYYTKVETNGKFNGFVYVFGYMMGARKYNNKETANKYWAVYFNEEGKHVFTKEFESDRATFFYSVHKNNDDLLFFVQGNNMHYGIIKLSDTNYKQTSISIKKLETNTINGKNTSGLKKSFMPIFDKSDVFVNDNGDFVVVLENKKTKEIKKGDKIVKVSTYNSFAVQFDSNGNFKNQYILPAKNPKSKSFSKRYKLLTTTPDKFVLISDEVVSKYKPTSYSIFYTSTGKTVKKDKMKYLTSPVVTVINISENKVGATKLSKDVFYRLSKDVLYCNDKNNSTAYFVGTNKDRKKLIVSKINY